MGKRLFIAVDIDEATREQIGRLTLVLRNAIETSAKVSWVRPDRVHLTLHFFGNADAALEQRVRSALAEPLAESPFDVSFDGLGCFPPRGSPRVVWLGVRDGAAALCRVQQALEQSLGAPPERERGFTPHLTLARFRPSTHARDGLKALEGRGRMPRTRLGEIANIPASAGPSRIDRVTLYESRLSPAGPTYVRLAESLLTPSG